MGRARFFPARPVPSPAIEATFPSFSVFSSFKNKFHNSNNIVILNKTILHQEHFIKIYSLCWNSLYATISVSPTRSPKLVGLS